MRATSDALWSNFGSNSHANSNARSASGPPAASPSPRKKDKDKARDEHGDDDMLVDFTAAVRGAGGGPAPAASPNARGVKRPRSDVIGDSDDENERERDGDEKEGAGGQEEKKKKAKRVTKCSRCENEGHTKSSKKCPLYNTAEAKAERKAKHDKKVAAEEAKIREKEEALKEE